MLELAKPAIAKAGRMGLLRIPAACRRFATKSHHKSVALLGFALAASQSSALHSPLRTLGFALAASHYPLRTRSSRQSCTSCGRPSASKRGCAGSGTSRALLLTTTVVACSGLAALGR